MYKIKEDIVKKYIRMEISAQQLFPKEAPSGTRYYDLETESGNACTVKVEDVLHAINLYRSKKVSFDDFSIWIDAMIALDLFGFDTSCDENLDKVAGLIYSLDDAKDDVTEIDCKKLDEIVERYMGKDKEN